jgi:hypothetical protein
MPREKTAMAKRRRRSRKSGNAAIFWVIGIFFFVGFMAVLTWYLVKKGKNGSGPPIDDDPNASAELRKVRAELDEKDPGWRLKQLDANQRKLDDAKNGAKVVLNLSSRIPDNVANSVADLCTPKQLFTQGFSDQELNALRGQMNACRQVVEEARQLSAYPDGAYHVTWDFRRPIDTQLAHDQSARKLAALLLAD